MPYRLTTLLVAGWAISVAGCSTVGGILGFSPPVYKMTPETEQLRDAQAFGPALLPKELDKAVLPTYTVEPGDSLLILAEDLDSPIRLPGDQTILPDGTIELGRFGRPIVAGQTLQEVEDEVNRLILEQLPDIDAELAAEVEKNPKRAPKIQVRSVGRVSKIFYVLGEVNAPGSFPLEGRETVLDGIIAAGNLTRRASIKNIILARPTSVDGCRLVLPICLDEIEQQADPSTNYQLQPGDRIFVPSKSVMEDLFGSGGGFFRKKNCASNMCAFPQSPCTIELQSRTYSGGGHCAEGSIPVYDHTISAPALPYGTPQATSPMNR